MISRARTSRRLGAAAALLALTGALVVLQSARPGAAATTSPVIGKRIIGYSVEHRPIVAYHLGDPAIRPADVIIGQMHGDEPAGVVVANSIIHGSARVAGINLWVIPTLNPDGNVRQTRQNAHHVDLNRNWPYYWRPLTGMYYSGTGPLSEPETRAVHRFLLKVHPQFVVSLHQPLFGVDTTQGGHVDPAFRRALSRNLHLPQKAFRCWSFCHGSMTGWYTLHRLGVAITVEFGRTPAHGYLVGTARRGIVAAMHGRFVPLG